MNIGDRIKKVRRDLNMTQTEFASRIGSVQNTVTGYENGRRNPSAPVIALICKEFNVNEEWLRTGEGEMFNPAPTDILDRLAREYKLSNAAYIVVEKFVNLHPEKRNELINFFVDVSKAIIENSDPNAPAILEYPTIQVFREIHNHQVVPKISAEYNDDPPAERGLEQMTVEEMEAEYKKSVLNHARKIKADSYAASNTTGEDIKKKNA